MLLAAFLALVFGLVGAAFQNTIGATVSYMVERKRRHHTAIARNEYAFGLSLIRLHLNVDFIHQSRKALGQRQLLSGFPAQFTLEHASVLDLYNLSLMNAIIEVNTRLESHNIMMKSYQETYTHLRAGFMVDQISQQVYQANAEVLAEQYGALIDGLEETREELWKVMAKLKVLGKRDRPLRMFRWLTDWYLTSARVTQEDIQGMRNEMRKDMAPLAGRTSPGGKNQPAK